MSESQKEPWLNQLALSTVFLAVCATLSTFKAGGYSTLSLISQQQASDQWAFYQAKSLKKNLYDLSRSQLQLARAALPAGSPAAAEFDAKIAEFGKKSATYGQEQADIQAKAKQLELQRDTAQKHGKPFGLAVIFLQVAILLSSVAGLLKKKALWLTALPVGLLGMLFFANGFWLFF